MTIGLQTIKNALKSFFPLDGNNTPKVNTGTLQADNSLLNPTGDSVQAWDHVDGAIVSNVTPSQALTSGQMTSISGAITTAALTGTYVVSTTSGTITLSGAATGTVTSGNPVTFTAYQATLTLTPATSATGNSVLGMTDPQVVFAGSATGALQLATISYAAIIDPTKEYIMTVQNTSAVTSVSIAVEPLETNMNGNATLYPVLTTFDVPVSSSRTILLRGILPGINAAIYATPDAAMTDATANLRCVTMRLRKF